MYYLDRSPFVEEGVQHGLIRLFHFAHTGEPQVREPQKQSCDVHVGSKEEEAPIEVLAAGRGSNDSPRVGSVTQHFTIHEVKWGLGDVNICVHAEHTIILN
eukprot:scaffold221034_cov43-Tisochrysis_lutea.AAC.2